MFIRHIQSHKIAKPNNFKSPSRSEYYIQPRLHYPDHRVLWYVKCSLIMSINVVCKQGEEGMLFLPVYWRRSTLI